MKVKELVKFCKEREHKANVIQTHEEADKLSEVERRLGIGLTHKWKVGDEYYLIIGLINGPLA